MIQKIIEVTVLPNDTIGILKRKDIGSNDLIVEDLNIDDAEYLHKQLGAAIKLYHDISKRKLEV